MSLRGGVIPGAVGADPKKPSRLDPKLGLTLAPVVFVLAWSSGAVFVKLGLKFAAPLPFVLLRLAFSAAIMWGACLALKIAIPRDLRTLGRIVVAGLLLQVAYQSFYFVALYLGVSPGLLAIVLGTQPIFTAVFSGEQVGRMQWLGLGLGLLGLVTVVSDRMAVVGVSTLGLAAAGACLGSITIGTILQKRHGSTTSLPAVIAIQCSAGAVVVLGLAALTGSLGVRWSREFVLSLSWMVLVVSVGATLLLYALLRRGQVTATTAVFYCVPPVTALLDFLVFGTRISLVTTIGMGLVVGGLFFVKRGNARSEDSAKGPALRRLQQ